MRVVGGARGLFRGGEGRGRKEGEGREVVGVSSGRAVTFAASITGIRHDDIIRVVGRGGRRDLSSIHTRSGI